jgi:hypothetical protein
MVIVAYAKEMYIFLEFFLVKVCLKEKKYIAEFCGAALLFLLKL